MFGRLSLRNQLLLSHLFLLAVALLVISVALLLFLSTRPVPPEPTYQRLGSLIQGLSNREGVRDIGSRILNQGLDSNFEATLSDFAETNQVRVILLIQRDNGQTVLFDSANTFNTETTRVEVEEDFSVPALQPFLNRITGEQLYGYLHDENGQAWLFGGISRKVNLLREDVDVLTLLAEPRSTISLQAALSTFASSLLPPLIQAGMVGVVIALALAFVISRSIARPLQVLSEATAEIAQGNHGVVIPKTGPQEVQALARAFDQMNGAVLQAQVSQRDFLANVSHDLKTPLTSIQGFSQAIMDGAAKDPAQAAQVIHEQAGRLNRMVTELTDLARIQAGRLSLKMTALDMGEMAAAIGQRLSIVARNKGQTLHIHSGPMPHIAGDGDRLAQVLENLLGNAIKYTPQGGEIWLKVGVINGGVEVVVQDTGMGIPAADLPRIFERFYQVDKARGPQRGTGLGLAITYEIVKAHGGTLEVMSAGVNQGTTFRMWLPSPQLSTIMTRR